MTRLKFLVYCLVKEELFQLNTRTLRVRYLDEESARELIVQPVEDFPNIYARTAVDAIIHLTHCQPYLVQLTCYEVVELLNRDILRTQARRLCYESLCTGCRDSYSHFAGARRRVFPGIVEKSE